MKIAILISLFIAWVNLFGQVYEWPGIVIEEDFTDTLYNGIGAGPNGENWGNSGYAKFAPVNNRPNIPYASLRYTGKGSGSGWDALTSWKRKDGKGIYFDKEFDVPVLWVTAFSDVAGKDVSPAYGVEVAMLEDKSGADYGHDLSFESQQTFIKTGAAEGPLQLDANVENSSHVFVTGTQYAHHAAGKETATTLGNTYNSLFVWRNILGEFPNIEQWGELNRADYDVDQKMVSVTEPIVPDYLVFNHVQIAFFDRVNAVTTINSLFRTGYDNTTAQIGISYVHLGITKVSDFNLNYIINNADADTLIKYNGNTSGHIRNGDATNDKKVNALDGNAVIGFWTGVASPASASVQYNIANGSITASLNGMSYLEIHSPTQLLNGSIPDLAGLPYDLMIKTDSSLVLFTKNAWNIENYSFGNIAQAGKSASDFTYTVNYKSSDLGRGVTAYLGQEVVITSLDNQSSSNVSIGIDNTIISGLPLLDAYQYEIFNSVGGLLETGTIHAGEKIHSSALNTGFRVVRIYNANKSQILGVKKYFNYSE